MEQALNFRFVLIGCCSDCANIIDVKNLVHAPENNFIVCSYQAHLRNQLTKKGLVQHCGHSPCGTVFLLSWTRSACFFFSARSPLGSPEIEKLSEKLSWSRTNGGSSELMTAGVLVGADTLGERGIRGALSLTACCEINEPCTEQDEAKWRCRRLREEIRQESIRLPPAASSASELCA